MGDIGEKKRIIEVEPMEVPERAPVREPVKEPKREEVPA